MSNTAAFAVCIDVCGFQLRRMRVNYSLTAVRWANSARRHCTECYSSLTAVYKHVYGIDVINGFLRFLFRSRPLRLLTFFFKFFTFILFLKLRCQVQTCTKNETCKLYSKAFWTLKPNIIKIDPYNFELYRFKVGAFFLRQSVWICKNPTKNTLRGCLSNDFLLILVCYVAHTAKYFTFLLKSTDLEKNRFGNCAWQCHLDFLFERFFSFYWLTVRHVLKFDNLHMTQCAKIIVGFMANVGNVFIQRSVYRLFWLFFHVFYVFNVFIVIWTFITYGASCVSQRSALRARKWQLIGICNVAKFWNPSGKDYRALSKLVSPNFCIYRRDRCRPQANYTPSI